MKFKTKDFKKNNYFVIYKYEQENDLNKEDEIVCYIENYDELSKYINYTPRKLAYEFNSRNTNIITIVIDNKFYKLATFCEEKVDDLLLD